MNIYVCLGSGISVIVYLSLTQVFKSEMQIVKSPSISTDLLKFLNFADDQYIELFKNKRLDLFSEYATENLCSKLEDIIEYEDSKLFGVKEGRIREWVLLEKESNKYTFKKILTHKRIKHGTVSIGLGNDMVEIWQVIKINKHFKVADIGG